MIRFKNLLLLLLLMITASCEHDPYSTGDGALSNLTTVFGDADFDSEGCAYRLVADNDDILNFTKIYGKPNPKLANESRRALLYYNITDEKNMAEPYMLLGILTANVIDKDSVKDRADDPVKIESLWLSDNKKYLNVALSLKTSKPDDESLRHKLGMLYESSQGSVANLRLIHDDSGIPSNYSVKTYFSVPVISILKKNSSCKVIRVEANTFDGVKTYELEM